MKMAMIAALLLAASGKPGLAAGPWVLAQSTLTYHIAHPLHESEGVSHAARGKGVCQGGQCDRTR